MKTNNRGWTSANKISAQKRIEMKNERENAEAWHTKIILQNEAETRKKLEQQLIELRKKYH